MGTELKMYNSFEFFNGLPIISKDPNAVLDYTFDWEPFLENISDVIGSVNYELSPGLTQSRVLNTATQAHSFIGGGVLGTTEFVTCRMTSVGGRIDDRTILLKIEQT
jgi:hypothetical protein